MFTTYNENYLFNPWERLQQPVHGASQQADVLRMLAALDEGWQILDVANYLAHGSNAEGRGYLLTLYHPQRRMTRECNVGYSAGMEALLATQRAAGC
jgi:hypothetical protein